MKYQHTQSAHLYLILFGIGSLILVLCWILRDQGPGMWIALIVALMMFAAGMMFRSLTIEDNGDHLRVSYGPLPVFGTRIAYEDILEVQTDRTNFIDGWGIHFVPFRGWTINLWGFDCARLTVRGRIIRLGTDDSQNLVEFLQTKISKRKG